MRLRISPTFAVLFFCAAGGIALFCLLDSYLYERNPQYNIETIEILPGRSTTPAEIAAFANLEKGKNIFSFSAQRMRRDLLAVNSSFRDVTVRKELPDKVFISVQDRIPVAKLFANRSNVLDASGFLYTLSENEQEFYRNLPAIENGYENNPEFKPGTQLLPKSGVPRDVESKVMTSLYVLSEVDKISNRPISIRTVDISNHNYLVLLTSNLLEIRIPWEDLDAGDRILEMVDQMRFGYAQAVAARRSGFFLMRDKSGKIFSTLN